MKRITSHGEVDLSFVTDERVRKVLEAYSYEANRAYDAKVYAGVVVLCGGVLEGLLTWALTTREAEARQRFPKKFQTKEGKERPLSQWELEELITTGKELKLVSDTSERLLRVVQRFRNFIHPYNVVPQSARPDEHLATIAIEAVQEVVRSIRGRTTGSSGI